MPVKYRLCAKQTHANLLHTQGHERQPFPPSASQALGCGRVWNSRRVSGAWQVYSEAEAGPCFLGSFLLSWCWRPTRGHSGLGFSNLGVLKSSRATCCNHSFHCTPESPFELWQVGPGKWINRKPSGGSGFESLFSSLEKGSCPLGCESRPLPAALPCL